MADHRERAPVGDQVLEAVNDAMVALHERYHGRKPASAHTQMLGDDMLACMLGGVYTDIEKTMIELQRQAVVHETRSAFQQAMEHRFIADRAATHRPPRGEVHLAPTTSGRTSSSSSSCSTPERASTRQHCAGAFEPDSFGDTHVVPGGRSYRGRGVND